MSSRYLQDTTIAAWKHHVHCLLNIWILDAQYSYIHHKAFELNHFLCKTWTPTQPVQSYCIISTTARGSLCNIIFAQSFPIVKVNMLFIFGKSNGLGLVQTGSERLRLWHHQDWKWLGIKTVSLQRLFPFHGNLLWCNCTRPAAVLLYVTVNVIQETHRHPDINKNVKKKEKKLGLTYNIRDHLVKL